VSPSILRDGAARLVRASRVADLVHRAHRSDAVILFYHDPRPAVFDAHLEFLRGRFAFTTLDVVVDAVLTGDWSAVPPRACVVTFDDGHRGNYDLLPVFRRHGLRPTIYLCSGVVATRRRFWFQQPVWSSWDEAESYKVLRTARRLEALKRDFDFEPAREYPDEPRQTLSRAEIEEMAPFVDFQAHTRFHPVLPLCTDDEALDEIAGSKRELEELLGRPCRHFAYPNGDYGDRDVEIVRRAGFASARTVDLGWARRGSDPLRLKAFGITDDASIDKLAAQLSGIPGYLRRRLQGSPGGLWPGVAPAA
jgi:peptidoglycan/xylan/chitin deacetylase (PgdA/CDA1 family)